MMQFERNTTTFTECRGKLEIPGGDIQLYVNHSTQDPDVVHWRASAPGFLFGNQARGRVKISTSLDDAMEEAEERCKAAADLLVQLAEMSNALL